VCAAPKTKKGLATRERIIAAAAQLVQERGVRATSLDDVLERAGASKSQLYHYFDDKADLMRAVVGHTADLVLGAQRPQLDQLDSWAAISSWFEELVELQNERGGCGGCPIGSLVPQLAEHDPLARAELGQSFDEWERHLADGLRSMRRCGLLRQNTDPDALAHATMASIQGGLLLTQVRRDPQQLRLALDASYSYLRQHAPA
jgi:TetR/AcrR family transcriptional regulator, transcriptional repressor for nem operon